MTNDTRPLLTIDQVAERLAVGRRTVYDMMRRGEFAWLEIGGRRKIEPAELDRFLAARRVDPEGGGTG